MKIGENGSEISGRLIEGVCFPTIRWTPECHDRVLVVRRKEAFAQQKSWVQLTVQATHVHQLLLQSLSLGTKHSPSLILPCALPIRGL
jgi:hypothetical protein